MLSSKIHAQATDTIFVYDKITVYDTVKIYDTIKVLDKNLNNHEGFENYFKKNNTAQNAVLAIDTATSKAAVILFNGNDTAAISINSIILSENLKNLETMKKEILTLAASALLTQLTFAQETGNTITAANEEKLPTYTISVGAIFTLPTLAESPAYGFSWNANKIQTKKLTLGISNDIGCLYQEGWKSYNYGNAQHGNLTGVYVNFFANASYYFLGNATQSKSGMYGKFGIGAGFVTAKQTTSYVGFPGSEKYENSSLHFSTQFCIGGDVKLGKGKLFTEIAFMPYLIEKY